MLYCSKAHVQIYNIVEDSEERFVRLAEKEVEEDEWFRKGKFFPVDPGVFVVSFGKDGVVQIWDANEMVVVSEHTVGATLSMGGEKSGKAVAFRQVEYKDHIWKFEMSSVVSGPTPELIALSCNTTHHVHLLDMASGAFTHTLIGHEDRINDICWSPVSPYVLVSASEDCTVKMWDVRKGGHKACLQTFDLNRRVPRMEKNGEIVYWDAAKRGMKGWKGLLGLGPSWAEGRSRRRRGNDNKSKLGRDTKNTTTTAAAAVAPRQNVLSHRKGIITGVAQSIFNSNGSRVLSVTNEGELRCWDSVTGHCIKGGTIHNYAHIATANDPNTVYEVGSRTLSALDIDSGKYENSWLTGPDYAEYRRIYTMPQREDICTAGAYDALWWTPEKLLRKRKSKKRSAADAELSEDDSEEW